MNHVKYMQLIGGKGGAKRATHPLRIEMARKAAQARWKRAKQVSCDRLEKARAVYTHQK